MPLRLEVQQSQNVIAIAEDALGFMRQRLAMVIAPAELQKIA